MTHLVKGERVRVATWALGGGLSMGLLVFAVGVDRGLRYRNEAAWIVGVVVAVIIIASLSSRQSRTRRGEAARMTAWIRDRKLPADVPLGAALTELATRQDQIQRALWADTALFLLSLLQLGLALPEPTLSSLVLRVAVSGIFAVILGWAVTARVRQVPVIRTLIREGQQRFASYTPSS